MKISKAESEVFGLKIGRYIGNITNLDVSQLETDVMKLGVDMCRIKVLGSDIELFDKLNSTNYHYELYNLNYYNKFSFDSVTEADVKPELHVREVVDPEADQDFIAVLSNLLESRSWVEYDTFLSKNLLTEEKKKRASFEFYSSFSKSNDGSSYTGLMYFEEEPIGLFMGLFKGDVFFGNLFGLIDGYRGKGLSKYFYGFMFDICKMRGIKHFENEVNIFNFTSQKSAISQNFLPQEIYYNLTIYPFCNLKSGKFKRLTILDLSALFDYLTNTYEDYMIVNIKRKRYLDRNGYDSSMILEPIHTESRIFLVVHFMVGATIGETTYIDLKREI
ncbi:MAG: hypothetical protein ACI9AB_000732 [Urechidicola sp.]